MTLATDRVLDHNLLDHILLSGFSRIPVHHPGQKDNFVGMLLVKKVRPLLPPPPDFITNRSLTSVNLFAFAMTQLISYNPEQCQKVGEFQLLSLPEARPDINCTFAFSPLKSPRQQKADPTSFSLLRDSQVSR